MPETSEYGPNRIREHRKRLDITQVELADRIGRDPAYVSLLETGKRNITPDLMYALAHALRITPAEVFVRASDVRR